MQASRYPSRGLTACGLPRVMRTLLAAQRMARHRARPRDGTMRSEQAPGDSMDLGTAPDRDPALTTPEAAGIGPRTVRARMASPALQALVALAVYLAVWVTARTYPLVLHPTQPQLAVPGPGPELLHLVPALVALCDRARLQPHPYHRGPRAHGLQPGLDHRHPGAVPARRPPRRSGGSRGLLQPARRRLAPLSAWAAFVLCRRITGRFWPALLGGAVYGFSSYEMNHMANGTLNLIFVLPRAVARLARPTQRNIRTFRLFLKKAHIAAILVEESLAPNWTGVLVRLGLRGRAIGGVILYPTAASANDRRPGAILGLPSAIIHSGWPPAGAAR